VELAGLLPRLGSLVVMERVLGESALMAMAWERVNVSIPCKRCWANSSFSYLLVDEALVLPRVLVGEVVGVAGELNAAGLLALAEEGVLVA